MTLKATLIFIMIAVAANAFATTVKTAAYAGTIQEQALGQVVGEANLQEVQRYQQGSVTTLVLKAQQTAGTRGKLDGADFVTLEIDLSKTTVHMTIQTDSVEDEEMLFQAYNGTCAVSETLTCGFSLGTVPGQRLFITVK